MEYFCDYLGFDVQLFIIVAVLQVTAATFPIIGAGRWNTPGILIMQRFCSAKKRSPTFIGNMVAYRFTRQGVVQQYDLSTVGPSQAITAVHYFFNGQGVGFHHLVLYWKVEIMKGFNDMATTHPDLAKEALDWDPSLVFASTDKKLKWKCPNGHIFSATGSTRLSGCGCPECTEYGFNPGKDAYFYLMERPGEQQFGITNSVKDRMKAHKRYGWMKVEVVGPFPGHSVVETERKLKHWLRLNIGLIKGSTENWLTKNMEVKSLAELKEISGIETDIF